MKVLKAANFERATMSGGLSMAFNQIHPSGPATVALYC
jgi:hypothetical protein